MSAKKVTFSSRPAPALPPAAEQWIDQGSTPPAEGPVKRMTFDVPESLHRRVKAGCAQRGVTIREVILQLLEAEFPASGN